MKTFTIILFSIFFSTSVVAQRSFKETYKVNYLDKYELNLRLITLKGALDRALVELDCLVFKLDKKIIKESSKTKPGVMEFSLKTKCYNDSFIKMGLAVASPVWEYQRFGIFLDSIKLPFRLEVVVKGDGSKRPDIEKAVVIRCAGESSLVRCGDKIENSLLMSTPILE